MRHVDRSGVPGREATTSSSDARGELAGTAHPPLNAELAEKLEGLPKDLAITLIALGVVGALIPGPVPPGKSFILLGTVILWPGIMARLGGPLARRCPGVFHLLIDFTDHLGEDLARRYPGSVKC